MRYGDRHTITSTLNALANAVCTSKRVPNEVSGAGYDLTQLTQQIRSLVVVHTTEYAGYAMPRCCQYIYADLILCIASDVSSVT